MSILHFFLAILVILIWGCNFIFIKWGLQEMSPFLLCAARFLLASIPIIFFIKPPQGQLRMIALYGLITFAMQFSFLFLGMHVGMTPGLASLLMQLQVFFSIFFAAIMIKEIPHPLQILGSVVSFSGLVFVALHLNNEITLAGFLLVISAAASWGLGNLISKKMGRVNVLSVIAWGSFFAFIPMMFISFIFDGPKTITQSLQHLSWIGIISACYISYAATWVAYSAWNSLLIRYPVATVAPFTLLVPIVGMVSSMLVFDEPLQSWKLIAAILVITGVFINLVGMRIIKFIIKKYALES